MTRIALLGASLNPPTLAHVNIVERLDSPEHPHDPTRKVDPYDLKLITPCGPRPEPEKRRNAIDPKHKATMTELAFAGMPRVIVDLFDLEQGTFTLTHDLDERYRRMYGGEVFHVIGGDLIAGGARGESQIQRTWVHGPRIWAELRYIVVLRTGYPHTKADRPPRTDAIIHLYPWYANASSTKVREAVAQKRSLDGLVSPLVARYIATHGLYA